MIFFLKIGQYHVDVESSSNLSELTDIIQAY